MIANLLTRKCEVYKVVRGEVEGLRRTQNVTETSLLESKGIYKCQLYGSKSITDDPRKTMENESIRLIIEKMIDKKDIVVFEGLQYRITNIKVYKQFYTGATNQPIIIEGVLYGKEFKQHKKV